MAIEFDCPVCGAVIRVKDEAAGKKGRCPKCKTLLLIPEPDDEPPPSPSPPPAPVVPAASIPPAPAAEQSTVPVAAAPAPTPIEPVPAFPPVTDPAAPFAFAAMEPAPVVAPVKARKSGKLPLVPIISAAAAFLSVAAVLATLWFLYRSSGPARTGPIAAERLASVTLPPVSFAIPADVPKEVRGPVVEALSGKGLALKSEFVSVVLRPEDEGRMSVTVEPGPQAVPVRLALGKNAAIRADLKESQKAIEAAKRKELDEMTASLFRTYASYLKERSPLDKLPTYRDGVALNATTGPIGYAVEAVIAGRPLRCAYEDGNGNCYFLLPAGTKVFHLRGRKLPDGRTPVNVDFEVTVPAAAKPAAPPAAVEEAKPKEPEAGKEEPQAADDAMKKAEAPKEGEMEDGEMKKDGVMKDGAQ
jgi:predicted Zn finger-like uncharacterized protein